MRIDSMDATAVNITAKTSQGAEQGVQAKAPVEVNTDKSDDNDQAHINEYARRELPVSERVVLEAVERANKAISTANRTFEYRIHAKTKQIMVKVINTDTNEVVREIPPEKVLDMVAKMMEMSGIMVDERR